MNGLVFENVSQETHQKTYGDPFLMLSKKYPVDCFFILLNFELSDLILC